MSTTFDAIYEHGIFKPISEVPVLLKEHEHVKITIVTDEDVDLDTEFAEWNAASDEDMLTFERKLGEIG